jgi:conjugal transfer pilus assembly protein TraV
MKNLTIGLAVAMLTLLLSGCAALPDSTLGHKCGIPDGVGCLSTQEVYDRSIAGDLPGLNRIDNGSIAPRQDRGIELPVISDEPPSVLRTSALYAPPEELRIWVNRWRDQDGDLHDDSFIYVLVGEGQWLVRD